MKPILSISSGMMLCEFNLGVVFINIYTARITETAGVSREESVEALLTYYKLLCEWCDEADIAA